MSTSELKQYLPQLEILTDEEIKSALAKGGLLHALSEAHIKRVLSPLRRGRPKKRIKERAVIQKRGRKSESPLSSRSTNIQLAEMAMIWMKIFACSATEAARATLKELALSDNQRNVRRLAKLISELPAREHDRRVRRVEERKQEVLPIINLSLAGQLIYNSNKGEQ